MPAALMSGCGKQAESAVGSQAGSAEGIQAQDAEPITIPAEEWTVDTLCQAMVINGNSISYPTMTMRDLGEGFALYAPYPYEMAINKENKNACCLISYYDKPVGVVNVVDCENRAEFWDAPIKKLKIGFTRFEEANSAPAFLNGFGVGDSKTLMLERLYFMDITDSDEAEEEYYFEKTIDDLTVQCYVYDGKLYFFTIGYQKQS